MNKNFRGLLLTCLLILMLVISGCSANQVQAPEPKAPVEEAKADAAAKVEAPKAEEPKPLPQDPNLEYVDTLLMAKLIKDGKLVSQRTSYNQPHPEWNFVLVDSRPKGKFDEGHIPGSINIPFDDWDKYSNLLPEDKKMPIYFYCGGMSCSLSPKSAHKAKEMGYENVYVYQEGEPFWRDAGNYLVVTTDYVKTLLTEDAVNNKNKKPYMILDARPYKMYFEGHIPNSIPTPDEIFADKFLASMPADKETEIISYCGGFFCGKSHTIADILKTNGYKNVKVYAGGLPSWTEAKLPVFGTKSSGATFEVASKGEVNRGLVPAEWQAKMNGNYVVLDVRTAGERESGAIKGSLHIPSGDITNNLQGIAGNLPADKNTTILIHCASGARAAGVIDKIVGLGYNNAFYLNNKIVIDKQGNFSF
ncbi:MAG: rhodanese-like domain-containing protein [Bacillota bacterium]